MSHSALVNYVFARQLVHPDLANVKRIYGSSRVYWDCEFIQHFSGLGNIRIVDVLRRYVLLQYNETVMYDGNQQECREERQIEWVQMQNYTMLYPQNTHDFIFFVKQLKQINSRFLTPQMKK